MLSGATVHTCSHAPIIRTLNVITVTIPTCSHAARPPLARAPATLAWSGGGVCWGSSSSSKAASPARSPGLKWRTARGGARTQAWLTLRAASRCGSCAGDARAFCYGWAVPKAIGAAPAQTGTSASWTKKKLTNLATSATSASKHNPAYTHTCPQACMRMIDKQPCTEAHPIACPRAGLLAAVTSSQKKPQKQEKGLGKIFSFLKF